MAESSLSKSEISSELNDRFRQEQTFNNVQIIAAKKSADERPLYLQKQPLD